MSDKDEGGALIPGEFAAEALALLRGEMPPILPPAQVRRYDHPTCCERGGKEGYRAVLDDVPHEWCIESDDYGNVCGVAFCPFCGTKLP